MRQRVQGVGLSVAIACWTVTAVALLALLFQVVGSLLGWVDRVAGILVLVSAQAFTAGMVMFTFLRGGFGELRGVRRKIEWSVVGVAVLTAALAVVPPTARGEAVGALRWAIVLASLTVLVAAASSRRILGPLTDRQQHIGAPSEPVPLRTRMRGALPWILLASAVGNTLVLQLTDLSPLHPSRPVITHADGSLSEILRASGPTVRNRYLLYADLAEAGADGVLVVPAGNPLNAQLVRGLSRMVMEVRRYPVEVHHDQFGLPDAPTGAVSLPEGIVQYWIVSGPAADTFWLARSDAGLVIVPESVAEVPEAME